MFVIVIVIGKYGGGFVTFAIDAVCTAHVYAPADA